MDKYVSVEKLMELSQDVPTFDRETKTFGVFSGVSDEDIKVMPPADVVEVVRCGKCNHGEVSIMSKTKDGEEEIACYCTIKNKVTDIDYYCPSGERKQDG